ETPEERIARQDDATAAHWQRVRDARAQAWREARRRLFSLPPEQRRQIREEWRICGWPGTPEYFATFLRWQLNGKRWNYQVSQSELQEMAFAKDEGGIVPAVEEQLALF